MQALSIASNYLVTLAQGRVRLFERRARRRKHCFRLMQRVIDNGFELTGPIARGDWKTVEAHLAAIRQHAPELESMYRALASQTGLRQN